MAKYRKSLSLYFFVKKNNETYGSSSNGFSSKVSFVKVSFIRMFRDLKQVVLAKKVFFAKKVYFFKNRGQKRWSNQVILSVNLFNACPFNKLFACRSTCEPMVPWIEADHICILVTFYFFWFIFQKVDFSAKRCFRINLFPFFSYIFLTP